MYFGRHLNSLEVQFLDKEKCFHKERVARRQPCEHFLPILVLVEPAPVKKDNMSCIKKKRSVRFGFPCKLHPSIPLFFCGHNTISKCELLDANPNCCDFSIFMVN